MFYRSIQVSRDRFDAAICVGTSAVYRRAALQPEGGPTLIPYAEDVHTGLDVRKAGWSMVYLPIVLSTGICPNNFDAFVRQQYRWRVARLFPWKAELQRCQLRAGHLRNHNPAPPRCGSRRSATRSCSTGSGPAATFSLRWFGRRRRPGPC